MPDQTLAEPATSTTDLSSAYRTHTCGQLRAGDAGGTARLAGWVHRRRDQGGLIFLDLRDRHGITQVVVDQAEAPEAHATAAKARPEFVLMVEGRVVARPAGTENAKLSTGAIEIRATGVTVLNDAKTPPFYINEPDAPIDETLRLKYRYLDLRREPMQQRIVARSRLLRAISEVHHAHGFVEVETPILIKSTPEGARDFIVPSRLQPGSIYALPQSPQQLKQLLMVAGFDRYFQIAHCMRDEDMRADRGPEFTQLDLEMSFVAEDDVMAFVETMVIEVSRAVVPDRPIRQVPFPRFTYREAIDRFGSDKPDVRFGLELHDVSEVAAGSGFKIFDDVVVAGGRVVAFAAPGLADASRHRIDQLTDLAKRSGAKGLVHLAIDAAGSVSSPIGKFLGEGRAEALCAAAGGSPGDLVLAIADRDIVAQEALGKLRLEIGEQLGLVADPDELSYVWVHRFPMYQWDAENGRWDATHNPFSGVVPEDEPLLTTTSGDLSKPSPDDPAGRARALQYDVALNGWELGGGSVRINRRELLARSFALQGHSLEGMSDKFGALLEAFTYGAPPHGGIAIGIDRWAARLLRQENIREVMAFPKTGAGSDLMLGAPSPAEPAQLAELGLRYVGVAPRTGTPAGD
ncbi:MAG TPA: aspartate--tRNA ligase [Candidatus Limnocylindrales bacterium]|nr:aspartate--tRNA ligase [Candidatus Limnocylindrales bacterium]